MTASMRVLIADDHALFRDGLRSLLMAHGVEVVGLADNGREALNLAAEMHPDVVLMDLFMPELGGLEATRRLSTELPDVKVVILTVSEDDADLFEAIKAGAKGYLQKDLESERFLRLLERVVKGEPAVTPRLTRRLMEGFARRDSAPPQRDGGDHDPLTDRELEVLERMVEGTTSTRGLARVLEISDNTVKFHLRNILEKLDVHDRAQVVSYALRHGIVRPPEVPD